MNNNKQKLELTWVGKDERPKLEPRILIEDPDKSYGDKSSENMLIYGDNLLALKALEQDFAGKIKCIYIDPPYNTGSAFEHYDDGVEQSIWLSLMHSRVSILHRLLCPEGVFFCSIDNTELFYLGALLDEIFGRTNRIEVLIWKKSYGGGAKSKFVVNQHEYVICYAKDIERIPLFNLPPEEDALRYYKYKDEKVMERGPYRLQPLATTSMDERPNLKYPITGPNGDEIWPQKQWQWSKGRVEKALANNEIVFTERKGSVSVSYKQYLKDEAGEQRPTKPKSIIDGIYTQHGTYESMGIFGLQDKFSFPKPEKLIWTLIESCTHEGDLILDSFLGSGTTAAVAQKMKRKWIGIELGDHCHTHCIPRLKSVIDGKDQGGISEAVQWKGGGGFRYYYLAPSLLKKDKYDNWVIDERYNPNMLAAAMAKHEGFRYSPDEILYWKQGQSTEKDFIFTTTNFITVEHLNKIKDEMKPGESLLICCKSFQEACANRYPEITVKKIPNMLLGRCEFGKEDYSLNIVNMPVEDDAIEPEPSEKEPVVKASKNESKRRTKKGTVKNQSDLFAHPGS